MPNSLRIRKLNNKARPEGKTVVYWMSREQRVQDNWALIAAADSAKSNDSNLIVVFNLIKTFPRASSRSFDFMLQGLKEVEKDLHELGIDFVVSFGDPIKNLPDIAFQKNASELYVDFSPLRGGRRWRDKVAQSISVPMYEADAHNVVPVWIASDKQEFAARTIRPKIHKHLPEFLVEFPELTKFNSTQFTNNDWTKINNFADVQTVSITDIEPGAAAAISTLKDFIDNRLDSYDEDRNDPNLDAISGLSPYLHFGQISSQRVALEVNQSNASQANKNAFLEELIVRKELSDNYCFYNSNYDKLIGAADWALKTIEEHRKDKRDHIYSLEQLENSQTHDDLWNAAQKQMVVLGKMHGYLRMYWAKKILEWTNSPEKALEYAILLNDKYELDGRDPNGYVGCLWSIAGLHDRAWFERDIFGKIRYMNYNGAKRKFAVDRYIDSISKL